MLCFFLYLIYFVFFFFFFSSRRRHTRFDCDWSSDVCSSDLISGAGAWLFGRAFLTSHTAHVTLPVIGELHVSSVFFFDLGVFSLVVGARSEERRVGKECRSRWWP